MSRSDSQGYVLSTNATATAAGVSIRGGEYAFLANGTPTGATISLQLQQPDGSWCDIGALAGNAIVKNTVLPMVVTPVVLPACVVRMAATGGTPTGINAWLQGIG